MAAETLIYVGTYTEPIRFGTGELFRPGGRGVHAVRVRLSDGAMEEAAPPASSRNPSYICLSPDRRHLYAVNELKLHEGKESGSVSSFALDPASGALRFLNLQATRGTDPCYVTTDREGGHVLVANYSSGSFSVFPVRGDGSLDEASDFVQHEGHGTNPERQEGPHAHMIAFDATGNTVFVSDLGMDRLAAYRFDGKRGRVTPIEGGGLTARSGAGPRHMAFGPDDSFLYVVNELDSTVSVCRYDRARTALEEIQTISTLPSGFSGESTCAAIALHPTGDYLYASNRGHDSIALFRRERQTGRLEAIGHASTLGESPRDFAIDPSGRLLLAANQSSSIIVPFLVDPATGRLEQSAEPFEIGSPVCIKFAG